jgi:tetratricopeptide (TPR) repeat protein
MRAALEIKPDYPYARLMLGSLYRLTGKELEAVGEFEEALRLAELEKRPTVARGKILYVLGRYPEAIDALIEQMNRQPGNTGLFLPLGLSYEAAGQTEQAISTYERALKMVDSPTIETRLNRLTRASPSP